MGFGSQTIITNYLRCPGNTGPVRIGLMYIQHLQPRQLNTFYAASQRGRLGCVSLLLIIQSVKTLLSGAFDALLLFKCTWKNNTQHSLSLDRNLE